MNIEDVGILVSKLKYGETSLILSIFSKNHGLQKGILKGALSLKNKSILEIGNVLKFQKRARSDESLGFFKLDLQESYLYKIFNNPNKLLSLSSMCELMGELLVEKEKDKDFYNLTISTIIVLQKEDFIKYYIQWELKLLEKIGLGLDLSKCTVSNEKNNLYYLSPKTGKAVTFNVGQAYHNKLFIIPEIFKNLDSNCNQRDVYESFRILNHFLHMFVSEYHKRIPFSRECLIKNITTTL
jgi:DNA repair protein RecO (recombination protein O)